MNCWNARTQHQLSDVTDSYKRQKRVTENNKTYKGQRSREDTRKKVREEDAWTVPM